MVHTLSIFQHTRGPHAKKETSATHTPPTSLSFQFYTASSSLANSTRAFNNGISKEYEKIERCEQSNFNQTEAPSTKKKRRKFFVQTTPGKLENVTITSHFGFVVKEN